MTEQTFVPFPKIPRLKRGCVITEKIDGTNACIRVSGDSIMVQSRNRIITPENDNYGFARWVREHTEELLTLGDGCHFGEWWGLGIQRNYGLREKCFSLFNVERWRTGRQPRPACCSCVPIIYEGDFNTSCVDEACDNLRASGSFASPGYMNPEGVVVFHVASRSMFKQTLENDSVGKEQVA